MPRRRRDRQVRPCLWVETTSARFSIERAPKRARQVSPQPAFVEAGGITRISAPRNASARVGTETGQVLVAQGDVFFSVVRMPGAGCLLHCRTQHLWHETPDRDFGQGIGSVVLAPREARRSSEPPIEKPEPGAPRMLGSGVELDADLRDRVPLHVAHD